MLLGVDTGGTFTDFVLAHAGTLRIHKVLSTPDAPERAILQGIAELGLEQALARGELTVIHGSTVATNAALERKGAHTLYITNRGCADILSIGRQTREQLYNLQPEPRPVPVAPEDCIEVGCRLSASGERISELSEADITHLQAVIAKRQPAAVAINLLYSFLDDGDEKRLQAACPSSVFSCRSSFVLPEYREYERGIATWLNAYLGPKVQGYLTRLQAGITPSPLGVMQSSGGTIDAAQAGDRAVNLLLSGPAGGLAAAAHFAHLIGSEGEPEKLLTFDMGGTSTDVALIDGELQLTSEGRLGPYPVAVPMVDMHTIGAGGGSEASIDAGGLLQVGPESAGAHPGPACYGKGGLRATVTDANAVLGRLRPEYFLGGAMALDAPAAEQAVDAIAKPLGLTRQAAAAGIIQLANEHMVSALRVISVQRGRNPREFSLCCFGGAGGLHVCALADELGMSRALVPIHGGVLSALGMLVAPRERQLSRTIGTRVNECDASHIDQLIAELSADGMQQLLNEGVAREQIQTQINLDLRYYGQSFTLNCPFTQLAAATEDFHRAHTQRYGHQLDIPVELVNVRVRVSAAGQVPPLPPLNPLAQCTPEYVAQLPDIGATPVYLRDKLGAYAKLAGPALICEQVSTTLLAPGWQAEVDGLGNLQLHKAAG
ncbi:hydantoinase/oxoprolinase family protein [uncultured Gilvimarinus sp.]|uniref:hydantoinase/oxoprolinase family protein n=1 Tax=uncultured Gilvimarinus sp. TaxID=1689143 RepID=UPI0030EC7614